MGEAKRRGVYEHRKALAVAVAAEKEAQRQAAWDALPQEEKDRIYNLQDKRAMQSSVLETIINGIAVYPYKLNGW